MLSVHEILLYSHLKEDDTVKTRSLYIARAQPRPIISLINPCINLYAQGYKQQHQIYVQAMEEFMKWSMPWWTIKTCAVGKC